MVSGEWQKYARLYGDGWARAIRTAKLGVEHPPADEIEPLINEANINHPFAKCQCDACKARWAWLEEHGKMPVAPNVPKVPTEVVWKLRNPKTIVTQRPKSVPPKEPAYDPGPGDPFISCCLCTTQLDREKATPGALKAWYRLSDFRLICPRCARSPSSSRLINEDRRRQRLTT